MTKLDKVYAGATPLEVRETDSKDKDRTEDVFQVFLERVQTALETYSNVHRGSGHFSMVTTHLYEKARDVVLDYLSLHKKNTVVLFCTKRRAAALVRQLTSATYKCISGDEIGLPLGVTALAVNRKDLGRCSAPETGGGTARLISLNKVTWASGPDRFEAGTPPIINVIGFAVALLLVRQFGRDAFLNLKMDNGHAADILYRHEFEGAAGRDLLALLRETLIGRNVRVPTIMGEKSFVNLDNSASTPTFSPIWNAVRKSWRLPHTTRCELVNEVRSIIADAIGAPLDTYDVIFTSNTTEGINLAAESFSRESEEGIEKVVLTTLHEHSSNDLPWRMVPGHSLIRLQMDEEGFIDLNDLEKTLCAYNRDNVHGKKRIKLVTLSGASNVLGMFNPIDKISRIVHQFGARLLVDGAQLVAHRKVDMQGSRIDCLAFSGHKMYAPFGCGVLAVKKDFLTYNSQELEAIRVSGEENIGGIAALGKAMLFLMRIGIDVIEKEERALTATVLSGLSQIPGLTIYGIQNSDSPSFVQKGGVIVFNVKGLTGNRTASELAYRSGIGVRFGCHCAHMAVKHILHVGPSLQRFQHALLALFSKLQLPGVVRVSVGIENTEQDAVTLIRALREIAFNSSSTKRMSGETQAPENLFSQSKAKRFMEDFVQLSARKVYGLES